MGAIAGVLRFDGGPVDDSRWSAALGALAEFGNAGTAVERGAGFTLAHAYNRFEATEPIVRDASGQLVAVVSARLDARADLERRLDQSPSASDAQLVLTAYRRWGAGCVDYLLGDFAFAIVDARRRGLFCARDRTGIRPLYYRSTADGVAFASTLPVLQCLCGIAPELDEVGFGAAMLRLKRPPGDTIWKGLKRLPPGSRLQASVTATELNRYWRPTPAGWTAVPPADWAETTREVLRVAVHDRMRERSRVGVELSGGLDSSAVAALAACHPRAESMQLFAASAAMASEEGVDPGDETPFARCVASALAFDSVAYESDAGRDPLNAELLDGAFARHGRPVNGFHAMDRALFGRLAEAGAETVLNGFWGDGTLSNQGEGWAGPWLWGGHWWKLATHLRWMARERGTSGLRLARHELGLAAPVWLRTLRRPLRRELVRRPMVAPALKQALNQRVDLAPFVDRAPPEVLPQLLEHGFTSIEEQYLEASSLGLEAAFPFLDSRVVELAMAIPPREHVLGGVPRSLFRRAMAGCLPEKIRARRCKGAFIPGFARTVQRQADLLLAELRALPVTERRHVGRILDLHEMEARLSSLGQIPPTSGPGTSRVLVLAQRWLALRFLQWHLTQRGET